MCAAQQGARPAQFPGHWEGDLIKGAAIASAVGTLVERNSRLVMLVKLPEFKPASAANVLQAFTDKLLGIAAAMRQSMTYDQGREMAMHKALSKRTGIAVYFCDPHSPWQRGSNEGGFKTEVQHPGFQWMRVECWGFFRGDLLICTLIECILDQNEC